MRFVLNVLLLLLTACTQAFSQEHLQPHKYPAHTGKTKSNAARTLVAAPAEDNYDVKYLKFNLTLGTDTTAIIGDVTTNAIVTAAAMPDYVFELDAPLTIDSVLINGSAVAVTASGSVRSAHLPAALPAGTAFTAHVWYHGIAHASGLYDLGGIYNIVDASWGARTLFTVSESYSAYRWWPCKQSLRDKIDSVDMWITVPDTLKAGSNGMLQAVTTIDATHKRYEWKERKPIDYYLVSVAVGPYEDYSYYMHFTGSPDSMLIQNYVYNGVSSIPYYKNAMDSVALMINYFSSIYGRYPFWKEKYGHSMVYWGGAEENQTMTTLGSPAFDVYTMSHELGHQWFGDNVTCGTWGDITMNEGFASYSSILFIEHFHGINEMLNTMYYDQQSVKAYDTGSVYVYDTTNENRIFDGRLSYAKGECVLHMLRFVFNNDNNFFNLLTTYQQQLHDSTGTIADFKNIAKSLYGTVVNGVNLDTFFTHWMYKEGFPAYGLHWNQVGNDVYIQIDQTTCVPSSVSLFKMPIELMFYSGATDTVVRIINDQPLQSYHFTWSHPIANIYFDPNVWLIYRMDSWIHDPTLGITSAQIQGLKIMPNPATDQWTVTGVPAGSTLALTDITGRTLWEQNNSSVSAAIPCNGLASGLYLLRVVTNGATASYKLMKQ